MCCPHGGRADASDWRCSVTFTTLRGRAAFARVLGNGQARRSNGVVLHWAANQLEINRYAVAAKTSAGKSVVRNRLRRWGRELLRRWNGGIAPGHDLVLIARTPEAASGFAHFAHHLWRVLANAELITEETNESCA